MRQEINWGLDETTEELRDTITEALDDAGIQNFFDRTYEDDDTITIRSGSRTFAIRLHEIH